MNDPSIKIGQDFWFQAKVISVKFKGDTIVVMLEEYHTKSKVKLVYKQQQLPET